MARGERPGVPAAYLEGEGVGRERERVALGLGEAAEEGERRAELHQVVRVRVHRRHLLRRAPQRRVPRLHGLPSRGGGLRRFPLEELRGQRRAVSARLTAAVVGCVWGCGGERVL